MLLPHNKFGKEPNIYYPLVSVDLHAELKSLSIHLELFQPDTAKPVAGSELKSTFLNN